MISSETNVLFIRLSLHQNVLTFTPPGFNQALNVKFPDSRLPVCVACKKNFKTKDMCRVRNLHTSPPWTTAHICMTLDDSCTDENGNYVDKQFVVRMAQYRPFCVMEDFPPNSKTPVCATCKKTNRTRNFCRKRHKHRKLPWSTVYVMLSTQESADPSTIVAAPSTRIETSKDVDVENNKGKINASTPPASTKKESNAGITQTSTPGATEESAKGGETKKDASKLKGDDINDIPESRTMLIQINDEECIIKWLQLAPDDEKGAWPPQAQIVPQQPKSISAGTGLFQGAPGRKYSYPPVAPATARGSKREAEPTIIDATHDVYHQQAIGGYNTVTGQPLAPALSHPYSYGRPGPQYAGHIWPYPPNAIAPPPRQNTPHPYVQVHQRPISPASAMNSPGGHIIGAPALSPSVTAGEAAAMRRKKPRRDFESEGTPDSRHPHPSPPPPPPAPPIVPQLHHQTPSYSQVPLASGPPHQPGPPLIHQQPHHPPGQIHQEHQPWMVYQQMYQAQLPPVTKSRYTEPPRMTIRTPESASRKISPS